MVFSTTSRSLATGARIRSVTRSLGDQYCRSPSRILRTSERFSCCSGTSGWTTTATSAASANVPHSKSIAGRASRPEYRRKNFRTLRIGFIGGLLECEADLHQADISPRLPCPPLMPVLRFQRCKRREIVSQAQQRALQVGKQAEDGVVAVHGDIFES